MTDQQPAPLHVFLSDAAEAALTQLHPGSCTRGAGRGGLDAAEKLVERLAVHPRLGSARRDRPGGREATTARTAPAADSGDRVSLVFQA